MTSEIRADFLFAVKIENQKTNRTAPEQTAFAHLDADTTMQIPIMLWMYADIFSYIKPVYTISAPLRTQLHGKLIQWVFNLPEAYCVANNTLVTKINTGI